MVSRHSDVLGPGATPTPEDVKVLLSVGDVQGPGATPIPEDVNGTAHLKRLPNLRDL